MTDPCGIPATPLRPPAGSPQPVRVVIADHQPLERAGMAFVLDADSGIEVVGTVSSGASALACVARTSPEVLVIEARLPPHGGIDLSAAIADRFPTTRVIVCTNCAEQSEVLDSLRAGASAFLPKGVTSDLLRATVKSVASCGETLALRGVAASPREVADDLGRLERLSPREREILQAVVRGLTNGEIAAALHLAESTVKSHIHTVFSKLHVRDRVQAVILGYACGLA